jgi:hypothetical protein
MTTAIDIIKRSLRSINVIGRMEAPTAEMAADALDTLNDMLGTWSNETLLVFQNTLVNFPLVPGQNNYTIGTGGNFNIPRPTSIESGYIHWNNVDYPLSMINTDQYDGIPVKSSPNQIPYAMLIYPDFPLTTIKLFPTPNDSTAQLFLEIKNPFTEFVNLTDTVDMPPGYVNALYRNLSMELAPEYGVQLNPSISLMASNSKKWLKRTNYETLIMELPEELPTGRGAWDQNGNYV